MIPEGIKHRAVLANGGNVSNFIKMGFFSLKFSEMISNLINGMDVEKTEENDEKNKSDDFGFLDAVKNKVRNMSVEFESAIGGRSGLYVMHYARSNHPNFNELTTLLPTITPENPSDPVLFIHYDSSAISENEVINDVNSSMEKQELKAERLFCIASSKNEALAIIPTEIPQRIKTLIDIVKKDKTLVEVLEKWAKRTILTGIPPIRIRNTNKILKEQLSKIFFQDEAEWEDYWRKRGFTDFEELAKTNFSYFLGSEHGVFLKPVGYE